MPLSRLDEMMCELGLVILATVLKRTANGRVAARERGALADKAAKIGADTALVEVRDHYHGGW